MALRTPLSRGRSLTATPANRSKIISPRDSFPTLTRPLTKTLTDPHGIPGGCAAKYSEPHRPCSSPLTVRKIIDRLGRGLSCANASASSTTATVPEASSSAPLQVESSPDGTQVGFFAHFDDAYKSGTPVN